MSRYYNDDDIDLFSLIGRQYARLRRARAHRKATQQQWITDAIRQRQRADQEWAAIAEACRIVPGHGKDWALWEAQMASEGESAT